MATVPADLRIPELSDGPSAAGKRVRLELFANTPPVVLYLPTDWTPGKKFPVIIELAGLGCVWACVPFLNGASGAVAVTWWGDAPAYPSLRLMV